MEWVETAEGFWTWGALVVEVMAAVWEAVWEWVFAGSFEWDVVWESWAYAKGTGSAMLEKEGWIRMRTEMKSMRWRIIAVVVVVPRGELLSVTC